VTPRDRRVLLTGGAVVLAAVLGRGIVAAWVAAANSRRELVARIELLKAARATVARLPQLEDSAESLRAAVVALAPALLNASTEADALADLSGKVTSLIERRAGRVESAVPVADSGAAGMLRRVSILASFETDVRGLASALRALSQSDVVLAGERVEIAAVDPFSDDGSPERLRVNLTVSAWYQRGK